MANKQFINILFPTGRMVWGDLYEPQTTDADGKPLVTKKGPDAGKPTQRFAFGVAIPKAPGQVHWAVKPATWETDPLTRGTPYWGEQIWALGHSVFPGIAQSPEFAWKVKDGDSTVPNKKNVRPCDKEGYPGNWVVNMSSSFAPRIVNSDGSQNILEVGAVKCGYYIQVHGTCTGNDSGQNPGVYLNHGIVSLQGYGQEIMTGQDPRAVGFGKGAAPAGMQSVPPGGLSQTPPAVGGPVAPPAPGATPPPAPTSSPPAPTAPGAPGAPPMPTAVIPHTGFLNVPQGAAAPAAAPPPPAAAPPPPAVQAGPQMTVKAGGTPYASWRGAGWTDEQLRANGYMV